MPDQAYREHGLDLDRELTENELPSPEKGPADERDNERADKLDTGPGEDHCAGLLQAVDHENTSREDEDVSDKVDPPKLVPRMLGFAEFLRPENHETEHANEACGNAVGGKVC